MAYTIRSSHTDQYTQPQLVQPNVMTPNTLSMQQLYNSLQYYSVQYPQYAVYFHDFMKYVVQYQHSSTPDAIWEQIIKRINGTVAIQIYNKHLLNPLYPDFDLSQSQTQPPLPPPVQPPVQTQITYQPVQASVVQQPQYPISTVQPQIPSSTASHSHRHNSHRSTSRSDSYDRYDRSTARYCGTRSRSRSHERNSRYSRSDRSPQKYYPSRSRSPQYNNTHHRMIDKQSRSDTLAQHDSCNLPSSHKYSYIDADDNIIHPSTKTPYNYMVYTSISIVHSELVLRSDRTAQDRLVDVITKIILQLINTTPLRVAYRKTSNRHTYNDTVHIIFRTLAEAKLCLQYSEQINRLLIDEYKFKNKCKIVYSELLKCPYHYSELTKHNKYNLCSNIHIIDLIHAYDHIKSVGNRLVDNCTTDGISIDHDRSVICPSSTIPDNYTVYTSIAITHPTLVDRNVYVAQIELRDYMAQLINDLLHTKAIRIVYRKTLSKHQYIRTINIIFHTVNDARLCLQHTEPINTALLKKYQLIGRCEFAYVDTRKCRNYYGDRPETCIIDRCSDIHYNDLINAYNQSHIINNTSYNNNEPTPISTQLDLCNSRIAKPINCAETNQTTFELYTSINILSNNLVPYNDTKQQHDIKQYVEQLAQTYGKIYRAVYHGGSQSRGYIPYLNIYFCTIYGANRFLLDTVNIQETLMKKYHFATPLTIQYRLSWMCKYDMKCRDIYSCSKIHTSDLKHALDDQYDQQ